MKICPNCNTKNSDDSSFCAECGTPLADVAIVSEAPAQPAPADAAGAAYDAAAVAAQTDPAVSAPDAPVSDAFAQTPQGGIEGAAFDPNTGAPIAPAKKRMFIPVLIAAAVVIILLLILLFGKSYKSPINTLVNNVNKHSKNITSYASAVLPDFALSYLGDVLGIAKKTDKWKEDGQEAIDDAFDELFDGMEDRYGKHVKVKCKIKSAKKLSKSKIGDIEDNYEQLYDMLDALELDDDDKWDELTDSLDDADIDLSASDIKKLQKSTQTFLKKLDKFKVSQAYKVKAELSIKGSDDDDETDVEFNVVKVNGKWYIDPITLADEMGMGLGSLSSYLRYLK